MAIQNDVTRTHKTMRAARRGAREAVAVMAPNIALRGPALYSSRSARVGSSRAARRAGSQEAAAAMAANPAAMAPKVAGSAGRTPTSMLVITRVTEIGRA